jgi:hypothetical protein
VGPLWLALVLLAADGGGSRVTGSVAAGGGYDASLLFAPGVGAAGSAVASVAASAGVEIEPSRPLHLYVGGMLDGEAFPSLPEIGRTSAGVEASGLLDVVGPLGLLLGASGWWAWYVDPERSGPSGNLRAALRLRAARWLALRAGDAHLWRGASDPVYTTSVDRLFGEVELRPWGSTWIFLSAFGERGDATFYAEAPAATTPAGTTAAFLPYRAPATTVGGGIGVEQGLGGGFALEAGLFLRRVDSPDGVSTGPSVNAALVWRFDGGS